MSEDYIEVAERKGLTLTRDSKKFLVKWSNSLRKTAKDMGLGFGKLILSKQK